MYVLIGLLIVVAFAISFFTIEYSDMTETLDNSMLLISAVKNGKIAEYYEYTVRNGCTEYPANYSFAVYVLFALWNLPSLALCKGLQVNYMQVPAAHCWCKLLPCLFLFGSCFLVFRLITDALGAKKSGRKTVGYLLSSLYVFIPVMICTQIDAIPVFLMLLGLKHYIEGGRGVMKCYICMMLAAPFKMFALMLSLPLILLEEKSLFKAAVKMAIVTLLLILEKVAFRHSTVYRFALGSQTRDAVNLMMTGHHGIAVLFLTLYLLLLSACWIQAAQEPENRGARTKQVVYIGALLFGTFCCFVPVNTYWFLYAGVFLCLAVALSPDTMSVTVPLETVGGVFYLLWAGLQSAAMRDRQAFTKLFLPRLVSIPHESARYGTFRNLVVRGLGIEDWDAAFWILQAACILIILLYTGPFATRYERKNLGGKTVAPDLSELWMTLRAGFLALFVALMLYAALASKPAPIVETIGQGNPAPNVNLLSGEGHTLTQRFTVEQDAEVHELTIRFMNPHQSRNNFSQVSVALRKEDELLREWQIGCSEIQNEKEINLPLSIRKLDKDTVYEISLTGIPGSYMDRYWGRRLVPYTVDLTKDRMPALLNSVQQEYSLEYNLR